MSMDVRAILFDVFGTVVDWRGSLIADLSAWGAERGLGDADWTGLVDAWRGAYAPSMDRVRRGEQAWAVLDDLQRATLLDLAPRHGLAALDDAALDRVNEGWRRLRPWPDSVPGLERLKRRYIVGTLTNGNVALMVDMAKGAGLPWDVIFSAELFRHYKPDPAVYLGACEMLRLPPGRVMLCAAHNDDLAAAQKQGLRTAFVPRPTEYGPHQKRDFGPEGEWDVVARSIEDLAARMGA